MIEVRHIPFAKLGEVIAGQHIPAEDYDGNEDGTPYLTGPADFTDRVPRITKWTKLPRSFAQGGDVLLTVKGAGCGKSNLGLDAAIGRQLMALRPDPTKLDRNYLFAVIRLQEKRIAHLGQGATVPGIAKGDIESLLIPYFPLGEQRRIAAILDKADRLRRMRRYALEMAETVLQPVFLEMFGHAAVNPKKWDSLPLGEFIVDGPQNGIYKPASAYGDGTPILRIDGFYDAAVEDLSQLKRLRLNEDEIANYGLRENDIVINRVNSRPFLGKSAIIPSLKEATVFESNMMRIAVDQTRLNPIYLIHFLQTAFVKDQIQLCGKDAVNQASINQEDVKGLLLRIPPLSIQNKFTIVARPIEHLSRIHQEALRQAEHLFQTLLHRAFTTGL